ncbi:unnamed protein product [Cylindrotheca closterium]|uniref:Tubulin-specific chaperone D n=1 Tax=Cylindrotheca closterium TaxID=2856 RepID=A0AAD2FFB9_9STRA|nr:unnamed protein product [Cylindrotheca closterium]
MEEKEEAESSVQDGASEVASSQSSVFLESELAFQLIETITITTVLSQSQAKECDDALSRIRKIFDKYLDLPSLMDKHIGKIVGLLTKAAQEIMASDLMDQFWDSCLPRVLSALYSLSKVRGRKRVQKFLPHTVDDVEVVFEALRKLDDLRKNHSQSDAMAEGPQLWESIHSLWNWVGILSLVPFKSSIIVDEKKISDLIALGKTHLSDPGPIREMAASCLASWLSRPEFEGTDLVSFVKWSTEILIDISFDRRNVFLTMGCLQTLVSILKTSKAKRETLISLMEPLWNTISKLSESNPSNLLLRKNLIKWWTRLGCAYLPPRVASWRYQRGRRSLMANLSQKKSQEGDDAVSEDSSSSRSSEDDFFFVPDEVEEAMGHVVGGLTDPSTIVRWSAAKGVGRLAERLPKLCGEDVVDALLQLLEDVEKDNDWHGACLAFAELARRGLLLPHRFEEVIPKIAQALHYDVPRRQTSVGAHVRDAACYTYWAFARAYSPEMLRPFAPQLSESVVVAFLFDREVNCRRAASAAFQEFVGRQGAQNFKHGISILTTADYFSLGNRIDAYKIISLHVAQYDEYRRAMIKNLYNIKLQHWDKAIRTLASQALGNLTHLDTEYIESTTIPQLLENSLDPRNVQLRHGAVLGLAEIVNAYSRLVKEEVPLDRLLKEETLSSLAELVPVIEKKRLYRGRGGEQMRQAVCRLIECISIAKIPMTVPQQVRLLDSIDACIPHPNEVIQFQAGMALEALMRSYFPVSAKGPSDRLQKRVFDKYVKEVKTSINPAVTRGFALALGHLPPKLLAPSEKLLTTVLSTLCKISRPDATVGSDKDAETRRNSLVALARICKTVGIDEGPPSDAPFVVNLTERQVKYVFEAFFRGLEDYNKERRGDVGSMSRIAAMEGLEALTVLATRTKLPNAFFSEEIATKIVGGLLKQLSEKLDAVRLKAGECLVRILRHCDPPIPYISSRGELYSALKIETDINWGDASVVFPLVMSAAQIDTYFSHIISGLIVSVGCLTQSVSKNASSVLLQWVKHASKEDVDRLGNGFLKLFEEHQHEGRVVLPLLKTIALLMERVAIDQLINDAAFVSSLCTLLREEEKGCKDVHRLTSIVSVTLGLVGTSGEIEKEPLAFVCTMLKHPFPRVRRIAAENLYVRLLESPDLDGDNPALELLLTNPWDSDQSPLNVKKMASELASALGVELLPSEEG